MQEPAASRNEGFQAGEPELGEFLALDEPAAEQAAVEAGSDDDREEPAPGQLAWDKASSRIRSPLLRLHSGAPGKPTAGVLCWQGWRHAAADMLQSTVAKWPSPSWSASAHAGSDTRRAGYSALTRHAVQRLSTSAELLLPQQRRCRRGMQPSHASLRTCARSGRKLRSRCSALC